MDCRTARVLLGLVLVVPYAANAADAPVRTGAAAYGSWKDDAPDVRRHFTPADAKAPKTGSDLEKKDSDHKAEVVPRPQGAVPKVPSGFAIDAFAQDLKGPRLLRIAPNGDLFVAESKGGRILVYKANAQGHLDGKVNEFAAGLNQPFGIVFYPSGDAPQFVYVAQPDKVVRYAYKAGDLKASGAAETILSDVPSERHWTRDLAIAADGKHLLMSVGSGSNDAGGMPDKTSDEIRAIESADGVGAAWGKEARRAALWQFDPDGKNVKVYATGLRNCVSMAWQPGGEKLWCVVNERDGLGDDVPFEYATTVQAGGFYGWPWYYIGANEDPRRKGERSDLRDKVIVPDVLLQPHSAPLGIAFYDQDQFPAAYRGDAYVTFHGSWNRAARTGYKVVRLAMRDGKPTGEYADFVTGFVVDDGHVWGRPVGVAVAHDGALYFSDDGSNTLWRVTAQKR